MKIGFLLLASYFMAWCNSLYLDDAKYKKHITIKSNILAKILIPKSWPAANKTKMLKNENPNLMSIFGFISYITTTIITSVWIIVLIISPTHIENINPFVVANLILVTFLDTPHTHESAKKSNPLKFLWYFSFVAIFILFVIACIALFIGKGFGI